MFEPGRASEVRPALEGPIKHVRSLDGIRAVAILLVFAVHVVHRLPAPLNANAKVLFEFARAGWVGVDLFFVLSGYLITSVLLAARQGGLAAYLKVFYWHRALRILPAYYVTMALVLAVLGLTGLTIRAIDVGALLVYVQNIVWIRSAPASSVNEIFGHTWSLAVEQHFYLIWPFVIYFVPPKFLLRVCACGIALALALRVALVALGVKPGGEYVFTGTRIDSLLCGAALAAFIFNGGLIGPRFLTAARISLATSVVVFAAAAILAGTPYASTLFNRTIGFSLVAFAATSALVMALGPGFHLFLTNKALVGLGKVSYCFYLVHLPVLSFTKGLFTSSAAGESSLGAYAAHALAFAVSGFVVSLGIAMLSLRFLEKPLLRFKGRFQPGPLTRAGCEPVK
jgi:peptidoglycan/LPS O-acetylase OafA/YrhL